MTKTPREPVRDTHIRVPVHIWKRMRSRFPEYGDVNRVICAALETYLNTLDQVDAAHRREFYGQGEGAD